MLLKQNQTMNGDLNRYVFEDNFHWKLHSRKNSSRLLYHFLPQQFLLMTLFLLFPPPPSTGFWFSVPLLLSIVSLVILLVLISILLYWKRHRNQDRGKLSQEVQRRKQMIFLIAPPGAQEDRNKGWQQCVCLLLAGVLEHLGGHFLAVGH